MKNEPYKTFSYTKTITNKNDSLDNSPHFNRITVKKKGCDLN